MLPVFSWQITSTSKDKGTHYLYMVKGPAQKKVKSTMQKNNQKKVINNEVYIKRIYNFVNVINSNKIEII